jgi:hypothetical protein
MQLDEDHRHRHVEADDSADGRKRGTAPHARGASQDGGRVKPKGKGNPVSKLRGFPVAENPAELMHGTT